MRLKFFFTQTEHEDQMWGSEGCDWALQMRDQILQAENTPHEMTDSPEKADIIVFWEPHQTSQVVWAPRLRADPLIHEFPNKAFIVAIEDSPLGFLPGLYVSLPARLHNPQRHRTWIYYRTQNPYIFSPDYTRPVEAPANLAYFSGANSHALRARIFEMNEFLARHKIIVAETERARFAPNPHDRRLKPAQRQFIDGILNSKFGLCPRGNGVGTYRLQETLALGRAPVIISDDWVPVAEINWHEFAVFISEQDIADLPGLLGAHEHRWREMGNKARNIYHTYFRRETYAESALKHIAAIYRNRTHDERDFIAQWDQMIEAAKRRLGSSSK